MGPTEHTQLSGFLPHAQREMVILKLLRCRSIRTSEHLLCVPKLGMCPRSSMNNGYKLLYSLWHRPSLSPLLSSQRWCYLPTELWVLIYFALVPAGVVHFNRGAQTSCCSRPEIAHSIGVPGFPNCELPRPGIVPRGPGDRA